MDFKFCAICGKPNYLNTRGHPCCIWWVEIEGADHCIACGISDSEERKWQEKERLKRLEQGRDKLSAQRVDGKF